MKDLTTNQTFSIDRPVPIAKHRSAEWIVEALFSKTILPLADFGVVSMSQVEATVNGTTSSVSNLHYQALIMATRSGKLEAQPSILTAKGSSFSVLWKNQ